jgi:hypothetical protein
MAPKNKTLVLSLFADEAAADAAVESLKAWDKMDEDVKLNAIGTIALDGKGKLKIHKIGRFWDAARGVGAGAIATILAGYILSPLLLPAVSGAFELHRKRLRVTADQRERLSAELVGGKAAVAVLVVPDEADGVRAKLGELGGSPEEPIGVEITPELETTAAEAQAEGEAA